MSKANSVHAEKRPLKEGDLDIDPDRVLKEVVHVRLPQLNGEMQFVYPPRQKRKGGNKGRPAKLNPMYASSKDLETKGPHVFPASKGNKPASASQKYSLAGGACLIYGVVGLVLIAAGLKDLLVYWVFICGALFGIVVSIKSVRFIVNTIFELLDVISDAINGAIDVLQKELEEVVTETLQDLMAATKEIFGSMVEKGVVRAVARTLGNGIDDAQKKLKPGDMVPPVARFRHKLIILLSLPCIAIALLKTTVELILVCEFKLQVTVIISFILNMVLFIMFALLSSVPVVCMIASVIVDNVEARVDAFLHASMKGGEEDLREVLRLVQDGADVIDNPKMAIRNCETCAQASACTLS
jgi:hypothetical protein